jgi:hypothetical protein
MLRKMRMRMRITRSLRMMGSLERTKMMRPKMTTPCRMKMRFLLRKSKHFPKQRELLKTLTKETAPKRIGMMIMVASVSRKKTKKARDS